MDELILESRKPSDRLIELVNRIPELYIDEDLIVVSERHPIFSILNGDINWLINTTHLINNPLWNAHRLEYTIEQGIYNITEESFCEVLEQHLELNKNRKENNG